MLNDNQNDLFLNYALGVEYFSKNEYAQAEFQFKKALSIQNDYVAAYYQLGKLFEAQNKITEALEFFKQGLAFAKTQKNNKAINEFGEAIFMLED